MLCPRPLMKPVEDLQFEPRQADSGKIGERAWLGWPQRALCDLFLEKTVRQEVLREAVGAGLRLQVQSLPLPSKLI